MPNELKNVFANLGVSLICIEAALERGMYKRALGFVKDALKEINNFSLDSNEIDCNEVSKRMIKLVEDGKKLEEERIKEEVKEIFKRKDQP